MKDEVKLGWRALPIVVIVFLIVGLAIGLWIGWVGLPVQIANVDATDLKPSAQDEMIALIADSYAYDKDLDRAKTRLAELKEQNSGERVAALAKKYAAQNQPSAANLATLALALGVDDQEIALIAATPTPLPTFTPPPTEPPISTLTPPATLTWTPTVTMTPTRTATRRPSATPTRTLVPIPPTNWIPPMAEWHSAANYQDVSGSVTPGQKFWHLAKALFCDLRDKHDYCQDLPGGSDAPWTYIILLNANGVRTSAPLIVTKGDGKTATADDIGIEKSADDMCNCNYTFLSSGWLIQVGGAPSDKVSGLALPERYHVRYFLTFQLVTR